MRKGMEGELALTSVLVHRLQRGYQHLRNLKKHVAVPLHERRYEDLKPLILQTNGNCVLKEQDR